MPSPMPQNSLIVRNPYDGKELAHLSFESKEEVAAKLTRARKTFETWRHSSSFERSQLLTQVAVLLEARRQEFAELIRDEAGKPITFALAEVDRALGTLRWAAAESVRFSGELLRLDASATGRPGFGIHQRFARGVILGITPFNFPLNLVVHKVAPAIASGCTILIKPSPFTPLTALKLVELFLQAGGPKLAGLVQVVLADDLVTAELTRAPETAMISFTGSARVGWLIRGQAPQKPTTLELGGNAWVIVMEDTPESHLPAIAKRIAGGAFGYAGQSCISVQNAAIASDLWPRFKSYLAKAVESTPCGDTADTSVICGPVINTSAATRIQKELSQLPPQAQLVRSSRSVGNQATCTTLLPPALVLLEVQDQPAGLVQDEIFGPVMTARKFTDLSQIISSINASRYGLQAGVFTQNLAHIERLYRDLEVGGVVVNDLPTTRYDHQPYGGVKDSGQGREGIRYAMEEMCESKFLALSSTIIM